MCYLKGKNQGWLSADGVNYMYLLVDSVLAWMYNTSKDIIYCLSAWVDIFDLNGQDVILLLF